MLFCQKFLHSHKDSKVSGEATNLHTELMSSNWKHATEKRDFGGGVVVVQPTKYKNDRMKWKWKKGML